MIFRMDTDSVRAMAARFRRTASTMDTSLASIRQSVRSAPWQSQAREEFILQLEMLHRSTLRSAEVLRLMALASDQKTSQWEMIGNFFNGPFHNLRGLWNSVLNSMGGIWETIKNTSINSRIPSLPGILFPATSSAMVLGVTTSLTRSPDIERPDWWPFKETGSDPTDKIQNLEKQRDILRDQLRDKQDEYNKYSSRVSDYWDKINKIDFINVALKSIGYDNEKGEIDSAKILTLTALILSPEPISTAIGLAAPVLNLEFQVRRALYNLWQMERAYKKSQSVSNEINELSQKLINVEQQLGAY